MLSDYLPMLSQLTILSVFLRLLLSVLLGGIVGIGRQSKGRAAGLRTHILVCMGAALVMMTGQYVFEYYGTGDPARLGAQVVSGISFLGVGTIMITGEKKVKGLTTAAGLWASAAMGLAIGIGFFEAAILACIIIFVVEKLMKHSEQGKGKDTSFDLRVYMELTGPEAIDEFLNFVSTQDWYVTDLDFIKKNDESSSFMALTAMLHLEKETVENDVVATLRELSYVKSVHVIS